MKNSPVREYLADNPRMVGVLFATMVLLSQAGAVAAGNCGALYGP